MGAEVALPSVSTNGHTVDMEVNVYVRTGGRLQNINGRSPSRRETSERTFIPSEPPRGCVTNAT